jgi:hypothetical protein
MVCEPLVPVERAPRKNDTHDREACRIVAD